MAVLLLHVHGVGGEGYDENFILKAKEFLRKNNLENKVVSVDYKWQSVNFRYKHALKDWNPANNNALNEYANFDKKIREYEKKYDKIYISAFS